MLSVAFFLLMMAFGLIIWQSLQIGELQRQVSTHAKIISGLLGTSNMLLDAAIQDKLAQRAAGKYGRN